MQDFIFHHKTKPGVTQTIPALTLESARVKLGDKVTNPQDYKHPSESEKKLLEYYATAANPHGEDEHSVPDEVHEARRVHAGV